MIRTLAPFLLGLLFGAGLLISGMTDPGRVIGFLDIAGAWNPSLAFVMGGAIAVSMPAFARARARPVALLGGPIGLPDRTRGIDLALVGGAALFGIGWGLAGICPGPALVLLGQDPLEIYTFLASMVLGSFVADKIGASGKPVPVQTMGMKA
jgi:uncharacterized protein